MRARAGAIWAVVLVLALTPSLAGAVVGVGDGPRWRTDFDAALADAKAAGRDVLVEFTGSDWCTWCIRLHDEVLSSEAFDRATRERFVLVQLDFPRDASAMPQELVERNRQLRERLRPSGYPTILLLDGDGLPYGRLVGYQPRGPWLEAFETAAGVRAVRDVAFDAARGERGRARAERLRAGLDVVNPTDARQYVHVLREIYEIEFPQDAYDPDLALQHYLRTRPAAGAAPIRDDGDEAPVPPMPLIRPQDRPQNRPQDRPDAAPAQPRPIVHNMDEFVGIMELLGVGPDGGGRPDVASAAYTLGVARALAYRYRVGGWPRGAPGNRAILALMAWAEHQKDLEFFAVLLEELPSVRQGLGGGEAFVDRLRGRLESLRQGTARGTFFEWLLDRTGDGPGVGPVDRPGRGG